jgi:hypothetical protein
MEMKENLRRSGLLNGEERAQTRAPRWRGKSNPTVEGLSNKSELNLVRLIDQEQSFLRAT